MNLSDIVARFPSLKIAVIGDAMVDQYRWGRVTKLSQEAPVPVFVVDRVENRPGGAANVEANLNTWGINTVATYGFHSIKARYMVGHYQVFREDEDYIHNPDSEFLAYQVSRWQKPERLDAIIISDYAKGMCRARVCEAAISEGKRRNIPIVVDPKGASWEKYDGATAICPNSDEYKSLRVSAPDVDILEKRGAEGIQIHYRGSRLGPLVPARARHVYDVTGAGDTVVAAVAAALGCGATVNQAAEIGCIAAGYVVGEVGTATCPYDYLVNQCESSSPPAASTSITKAITAS